MTNAGYEFTAAQNERFDVLVRNMKRAALVVAIASLILLTYHLIGHFGVTLGGTPSPAIYWIDLTMWLSISVIGALVAVLLVRATRGFIAMVQTEGNDIEHLMDSVTQLSGLLRIIAAAGAVVTGLLSASLALLILYA